MNPEKYRSILPFLVIVLLYIKETAGTASTKHDDEAMLKCDACKIIAQRFKNSFRKAEIEVGEKVLNEDEYIEAAEGTCDEDWNGYGVQLVDGVQRLAGSDSEVEILENTDLDQLWDRRLQDFCDELLAEAPDEKTLYRLYAGQASELEDYLCRGDGMLKACVPQEPFGPWPGDDFDDYDDIDFDYVHDEF